MKIAMTVTGFFTTFPFKKASIVWRILKGCISYLSKKFLVLATPVPELSNLLYNNVRFNSTIKTVKQPLSSHLGS